MACALLFFFLNLFHACFAKGNSWLSASIVLEEFRLNITLSGNDIVRTPRVVGLEESILMKTVDLFVALCNAASRF
ncbi:hypothetical protein RJT34_07044 [Clitoria ternatea]|uniref:Secreted protein n=1 Tax=Clitoria ternatea TaxID=43366 RepID=A0AAN9PTU7_CLITE